MNNWKLIIATVVIFGTGVITGGLLVNYVQLHPNPPKTSRSAIIVTAATNVVARTNTPSSATPRLPEMLSKPFLPKLNELLRLSPEQRKAIEKIISDGQGQLKKVMADARGDIRNQLKGDQRKQFDDLMKLPPKKSVSATNAPSLSLPEKSEKPFEATGTNMVSFTNSAPSPPAATNTP